MNKLPALGIIDAQRGFMPAIEGERLGLKGFGELTVPAGEKVIPVINKLLTSKEIGFDPVFTTQDWHPTDTAHFSAKPDYMHTWPVHCVQDTDGAALHPELKIDADENPDVSFFKGQESLLRGEDDTSYSGFNAVQQNTEHLSLPEYLAKQGVETVVLGGLALDYCVKATALDLKKNMGMEVIVVSDATKPVAEETGRLAIQEMTAAGIRFITSDELITELRKA